MATVFVYLESAADTPLVGASPVLDYWDKSIPGAPAATGVAMTELIGGIGGGYFADVATTDGREYLGIVDATAGALAGTRYQLVVFSGETDARLETDVPAVLADTIDIQSRLPAALVGGRMDSDVGAMQADTVDASALAADAVAEIDTVLTSSHGAGAWITGAGSSPAVIAAEVDSVLTSSHGGGSWRPIIAQDWSVLEREQIRFRLSLDGVQRPPITDRGTLARIVANEPDDAKDDETKTLGNICRRK